MQFNFKSMTSNRQLEVNILPLKSSGVSQVALNQSTKNSKQTAHLRTKTIGTA